METNELGKYLKGLRESMKKTTTKKLTLKDLAEETGLSEATIQKIESGQTQNPSGETINILADALKVNAAEILKRIPKGG